MIFLRIVWFLEIFLRSQLSRLRSSLSRNLKNWSGVDMNSDGVVTTYQSNATFKSAYVVQIVDATFLATDLY